MHLEEAAGVCVDAEGYKYIVWVFNGRFAILSPELCPPSSFIAKESLSTAACYHSTQKRSCFHENSRPRTRASVRRAAASSKSPFHFSTIRKNIFLSVEE